MARFDTAQGVPGAAGDGVNDDTEALQAYFDRVDAATYGGVVTLPPGQFLVSASLGETEIFLVDRAIQIVGAGMGQTTLVVASTTPTNCDIIRYAPSGVAVTEARGFTVSDLMVKRQSGTPARHIINLDTSASGIFAAEILIDRCFLGEMGGTTSGRAIEVMDSATPSTFHLTIRGSVIQGGIRLLGVGDSINIIDNIITGTNVGIEADQIGGAALLHIARNNITANGGGIWLKGAVHPIIAGNWCERTSGVLVDGSGNSALIDLDGSASDRISLPEVRGNMLGTAIALDMIRVNYADQAQIEGNTFTLSHADSRGVRNTANSTATYAPADRNRVIAGGASRFLANAGVLALGHYSGSGAPDLVAAKGSTFARTDGSSSSTRLYVATDDAGTWVAVTTAS